MPYNRWKELQPIQNGYALDAKYWNYLTAPHNNLAYLYESQYLTDAYLALNYTNATPIANATLTTISWTSAVSQNYPGMWNILDPTYIYFDTEGSDTWGINLQLSYAVATISTRRLVQFVFADGGEVAQDAYEDFGSANLQHQFFFPYFHFSTAPTQAFQVNVSQTSGAALVLSANLFINKIPTPLNNFETIA
jgi:hypothetical protein